MIKWYCAVLPWLNGFSNNIVFATHFCDIMDYHNVIVIEFALILYDTNDVSFPTITQYGDAAPCVDFIGCTALLCVAGELMHGPYDYHGYLLAATNTTTTPTIG